MGYRDSGKTTVIEHLTAYLVGLGKRVGVLKHVHADHLDLGPKSKDTSRFAAAGAHLVCAVSSSLFMLLQKDRDPNSVLELISKAGLDYLLVEGFSSHQRFLSPNVRCVVCAHSESQAAELVAMHSMRKIVCITGKVASTSQTKRILGVPVLTVPRDTAKIVDLIS